MACQTTSAVNSPRFALRIDESTRTLGLMGSRVGRRIARLRPGDFVQAVAILAVAARVEYSLHRHDLPATASRFGLRLGSPSADTSASTPRQPLPRWAVRRARLALILMRRWPFGDTCLRQSLVIGNRLRSLAPQLFIGVRASGDGGPISAHAWLQICGIDIDPAGADYLAFDFA